MASQQAEEQFRSSASELELANYQTYYLYQWNKRSAALGFSLTVNDLAREAFEHINGYFGPLLTRSEPISRVELETAFSDEPKIYTSLIIFLSHYERLATAIAVDIADDRTAFEYMGDTVCFYVGVFREFISWRRESQRHARSYIYLEELVKRWENRLEGPGRHERYDFSKPDLGPPERGKYREPSANRHQEQE